MVVRTPTDQFDRPAMLGSFNGSATPVKVTEDGELCVSAAFGSGSAPKYMLVQSLRLDLSVARVKELHSISFDSLAVTGIQGSFSAYIGSADESNRCTIDKCLSVMVSADAIYFSNEPQSGYAEIWLFRLKEASSGE